MRALIEVNRNSAILRELRRIAEALERAYPPPTDKPHPSETDVVEFSESEEAKLAYNERAGDVPWDQDEEG